MMMQREGHRLWVLAGAFWLAMLAVLALPARAQTLVRDAEIEAALREFTDPILVAADLQPSDVGIYIINDNSLNAFVAFGQRIHLHTGLIIASETPAQLKGVIAHETGHIAGAHGARRAQDLAVAARPAYISIGLGLLALAAGEAEAGAALIASSQQFAALNFFIHTRVQEASADQAAVTYLEKIGVSPIGLIQFFEKFRYQEVLSEARRFEYFRTHPISADRIQALRQRGAETGLMDTPDDPADVATLRMIQAKLIGFTRPIAEVLQRFPKTDTSDEALYARSVASYLVADTGSALRDIDTLIARQPDNPYFHELKGQILFESDRAKESVAPIETALALSGSHPLIGVSLARSLVARADPGDLVRAEELLRAALLVEPDNAFAWANLAVALDRLGRPAEAQLATAEQAFAIGNMPRAHVFAGRAMQGLPRGEPLWVRASDIQAITDPRVTGQRGGPPGRFR
jgi:predicted Zn-dependent protease